MRQVGDDEAALDVLAERDQHRVVVALRDRRAQHVAEHHDLRVGVRDLDADRALARDRAEDAHLGALHRVGDVAGQVGDPLDLDARAELDLVAGDGRAAVEAGDRAVDVELGEHLLQRGDHLVVGLGVLQVRGALRQDRSASGSVYRPGAAGRARAGSAGRSAAGPARRLRPCAACAAAALAGASALRPRRVGDRPARSLGSRPSGRRAGGRRAVASASPPARRIDADPSSDARRLVRARPRTAPAGSAASALIGVAVTTRMPNAPTDEQQRHGEHRADRPRASGCAGQRSDRPPACSRAVRRCAGSRPTGRTGRAPRCVERERCRRSPGRAPPASGAWRSM